MKKRSYRIVKSNQPMKADFGGGDFEQLLKKFHRHNKRQTLRLNLMIVLLTLLVIAVAIAAYFIIKMQITGR